MLKPNVISLFKTERYEDRFMNVDIIGKAIDIFVECVSYDIELPVNVHQTRESDIFEEAVLRMINLKKCSPDELSDILCLEKDLVEFIIIRLIENGLLKDQVSISQKGKELLTQRSKLKQEIEYVYGKLFVIPSPRLILPYIHIGEFQSEGVDDFNDKSITAGFGSAGQYRTVKGSRIKCFTREKEPPLSASEVGKAVHTFNNIARLRSLPTINISSEYSTANFKGESVYFHMKAAIQEGNVDYPIISDGFVPNIDGMFEYLQSSCKPIFGELKRNAAAMDTTAYSDEKVITKHSKYKKLYHFYENAKKHIIEFPKTSKDASEKIEENKKQVIIDCYYSLEWCFYYYLQKHPLSDGLSELLKSRSAALNCETLCGLAKKIGLRDIDKYKNLFMNITSQSIEGVFKYSSPKMNVCLPLAVAEASENSSANLHSVIQTDSNILRFLYELIKYSGALRHDAKAQADLDAAEALKKTESILVSMLPELELKSSAKAASTDNISQLKLSGQISLEKAMGSIMYYSLSKALRDEWLKISPDKRGNDLPDLREYIEVLYRIVQTQLKAANDELPKQQAYSKDEAIKLCLSRYADKLPRSFTTIKPVNFDNALKGGTSTLGAHALVYYTYIGDELIPALNEQGYITLIDKIITLRGHNDLLVLNESEGSLNELRDRIINLSKIIGGHYEQR